MKYTIFLCFWYSILAGLAFFTSHSLSLPVILLAISAPITMVFLLVLNNRRKIQLEKLAQQLLIYGKGDLRNSLPKLRPGDELENLYKGVESLRTNIAEILGEMRAANGSLSSTIKDFSGRLSKLEKGANQSQERARTVAAAAEESGLSSANLRAAASEMSQSVNAIAAAMEEMTATISVVEGQSREQSLTADRTEIGLRSASLEVGQVAEMVQSIDKVTGLIAEIAKQTNLLALNATIEAASAGEKGKGFTVVAGEIKELSRQTAAATEEIRAKITEVRAASTKASQSVFKITAEVEQVSISSKQTLHSIAEQRLAAQEINQNMSFSSTASTRMAQGVAEMSAGAHEVAQNISVVHDDMQNMSKEVVAIGKGVGGMENLMARMERTIQSFQLARFHAEFSASLRTHVGEIDAQHQKLFNLLNTFAGALADGQGNEALLPLIDELASYAIQHFKDEEKVMERIGYPGLAEHKAIHRKFEKTVMETRTAFAQGRGMLASQIISFLAQWLVEHIGKQDLHWAAYAARKGHNT